MYIFKTILSCSKKINIYLILIVFNLLIGNLTSFAQIDTLKEASEELLPVESDSIGNDTIKNNNLISDRVQYKAQDSSRMSFRGQQRVYLYGQGEVSYISFNLKADYIDLDLENNLLFAKGRVDSTGNRVGRPVFVDKDETFEADSLFYNFKTKKALTYGVATKQTEGYLTADIMKKHSDGFIHLKGGKFTTCDHENPHYYIALTKAKALPQDKIISGPFYFVIADIPTPIALPFGYFPDQKQFSSGILIPSYGEENARGFYLQNGGYYWAMGEYSDLQVVGDIYSQGSWGFQAVSQYKARYRFNGKFNLRYNRNILGEEGTPNYSRSNSYQILWTHTQDPKARPNSSFSANVDFKSSNSQKFEARNDREYLSNTFGSSISYRKSWANSPFNFSANLRHSQNTSTKQVNLTLPSFAFSMTRQYPAQVIRKWLDIDPPATERWYHELLDKISISYNANLENTINGPDSLVFQNRGEVQNGFMHDIPISASIKFLKHFTLTPSMKYSGRLYSNSVNKIYNIDSARVEEYFTHEVKYAHIIIPPSLSLGFSPKIFGFFKFKNPDKHKIKAVRHTMMPSISVSYKPTSPKRYEGSEYWNSVVYPDDQNSPEYFIYEDGKYRLPKSALESGSISLGLNNNVEMKVRDDKDTTQAERKITIIDRLKISTSYNHFSESYKWSNISIGASTKLFRKLLGINLTSSLDPYAVDSVGTRYDELLYKENGKIARLNNINLSMSMSLNSKDLFNKNNDDLQYLDPFYINPFFGYQGLEYVNFDVPWNLSFSYTLSYAKRAFDKKKQAFNYDIIQNLSFNGNFQLTPKWKMGFSSRYDFQKKKLGYTSANLYRDLHCWEMRLNWVPFGDNKSYNFQINIKSAIFKDLKYKKEKSRFDQLGW